MRAFAFGLGFACVAALSTPVRAAPSAPHVVPVAVGDSTWIACNDVRAYSLGNAKIARIAWDWRKRRLVIEGREPGSGPLLVVKKDGTRATYVVVVLTKLVGDKP